MLISCLQCGGSLVEGAAFCQRCGAPVGLPAQTNPTTVCSSCGNQNPAGTNFCRTCGRRLGLTTPVSTNISVRALVAAAAARPSVQAAGQKPGPRLVAVRRDGSDGESYPLVGEQIDLGRSEGDLHFEDPHLAPRHARISLRSGQFVLSPLEGRNGIYRRITEPTELSDGHMMLVGKQVLCFELLTDVEKTLRPALEHGVLLFGTPLKSPWGRLRQITSAGTTRDVFHLTRSDLVIGREQGDVVFSDDEFMSRRHALLQFRNDRALISDLGSSNGTYVRLAGQHTLAPGEMIRLGDAARFETG